jgi:translation initiation factor 4E
MDTLWTRRSNTANKLSLSTASTGTNGAGSNGDGGRPLGKRTETPKRAGFGSGTGLTTPSSAASTAFALGSGALSFGSGKTPKTPGATPNPFDSSFGTKTPTTTTDRPGTSGAGSAALDDNAATTTGPPTSTASAPAPAAALHKSASKAPSMASISEASATPEPTSGPPAHTFKDAWSFWFRPPLPKGLGYMDYEKTLHGIATFNTAEDFFAIYAHLKRPSTLPPVSDYHLFKDGIRPIWEDDENKKGGKWVVRMKKGVADRYWEDLLLALLGDQFADQSDEVCGAVLSVRNGEDTLSIWVRTEGPHTLKIRDAMKHILNFPANTKVEWKSHDSSIQQRTTVVDQRREKAAAAGANNTGAVGGDQRHHNNPHHNNNHHHNSSQHGHKGGADERRNGAEAVAGAS